MKKRKINMLNPDIEATKLGSKVTVQLKPNDVVSCCTCGGGGYGPPETRAPQLVLRDVRDGKISIERAKEVYKVIVDKATWIVNTGETAKLRVACE